MPNIHRPLPETEQSIFRPVVLEVVRQVQKITGMPETRIYFPDEEKKNATSSGTIDDKARADLFVKTNSNRLNEIEVEEEADREEISPTFFNGIEYTGSFEDRRLGIKISPVYAKHNVSVVFKYQCEGKNEATRWLQDMRMKLSRIRDINEHTVEYHYNLHTDMYEVLETIYSLRETQGGYGDSFDQYIKLHANPRITVIGDLVGENKIFAFAERQTEIYGIFDWDALPPKPTKEQESGMWVIGFSYKFNYDKPVGAHMKYPIAVHNQLLPKKYTTFMLQEVRSIAKMPFDGSRSQRAFQNFRADRVMDRIKSEQTIIVHPPYDDWSPDANLQFSAGVAQLLAFITPTDKRLLFNLNDLGDIVLDDDFLNFIKLSERPYITQPYKSIIHMDLYQNGSIQDYTKLTVDADLNVSATADLDIRSQYRVRLSVISDPDFIQQAAIERVRLYPKALYKIVRAINQAFRERPELTNLGNLERLSVVEFDSIYRGILGKEPKAFDNIGWGTQNVFRNLGLSAELLRKITYESRFSKSTMISGILAFNKKDPGLQTVNAENIDVPVTG